MALTNHPFEFKARWRDVLRDVLSDSDMQLLDERDRDLEDFLATVGGGSGIASALRRTTSESHDISTSYNINFSTPDYLAGMTASGGTLVCSTAGVWHLTTSFAMNADAAGGVAVAFLVGGTETVTYSPLDADEYDIPLGINLSMDTPLEVGDVVRAGVGWGGGEVGGVITVTGTTVLRLSAHLVG